MRVAVLAGGRTPERDVSLRSGHRVMTSLSERGHDAWVLDPGERPLVEALGRTPAGCLLPRAARERGRGRNRAAVAGPARSALHGNRRVRMRGRLRQTAREGRAPPRRGRHAGLGGDRGMGPPRPWRGRRARPGGGTGGAALRGEAVAEWIGARRRVRGTRGGHRAGRDGGAVVQRSGRDRIDDRRNRDRRELRRLAAGSAPPRRDRPEGRRATTTRPDTPRARPSTSLRRGSRVGSRAPRWQKRRARRTVCVCGT